MYHLFGRVDGVRFSLSCLGTVNGWMECVQSVLDMGKQFER